MSHVPRSLQSWFSTIKSVVLTADDFKQKLLKTSCFNNLFHTISNHLFITLRPFSATMLSIVCCYHFSNISRPFKKPPFNYYFWTIFQPFILEPFLWKMSKHTSIGVAYSVRNPTKGERKKYENSRLLLLTCDSMLCFFNKLVRAHRNVQCWPRWYTIIPCVVAIGCRLTSKTRT